MAQSSKSLIMKEFSLFLNFYRVCGLSFAFNEASSKWRRVHTKGWTFFAFRVSYLTVFFFGQMIYMPLAENKDSEKTALQKSIATLIFFLLFFFSGIATLFQSILCVEDDKVILENFKKIAELLWNRAYSKIEYAKFKKQFKIKIFGNLLVFYVLLFLASAMDLSS